MSLGKALNPSFFYQLRHQPIKCAFSGHRSECCISLHSRCQFIDGKCLFAMLAQVFQKYFFLFSLISHPVQLLC